MKRLLLFALGMMLAGSASAQVVRCQDSASGTLVLPFAAATDHPCVIDHTTGEVWTKSSVSVAPTTSASAGIAPVTSTAAEANHVLKASAGNLYGLSITTGATAGFVLLFDATSAPVDGAVTPKFCYSIPASTTAGVDFGVPSVFATGITVSFSSTGCFTKTASATAFFAGSVK